MNTTSDDPRALLLALHKAAVQGANPFLRTREAVSEWIGAGNLTSDARIHGFALGKAAATMMAGAWGALDEAGLTFVGGACIPAAAPSESAQFAEGGNFPPMIEVRVGDHPVPGIGSLAAADLIARKVKDVRKGDIALVLISGGATSLCASPCSELRDLFEDDIVAAHEELTRLIQTLHERGLAIHEMNAIRRRLLRWGGGRLAVALRERGASQINVCSVSDVIGDDPSVIGSGPCSPDPMSTAEFLAMLDAYQLREHLPGRLSEALGLQGDPSLVIIPPDPTHDAFSRVQYRIVARNEDSRRAMAQHAATLGIQRVTVIEPPLTGEAETVGHTIGAIATRAAESSNEAQLIIWGGEPTVTMHADHMSHRLFGSEDSEGPLPDTLNLAREGAKPWIGMEDEDYHANEGPNGGRMQALALAACLALEQASFRDRSRNAERITLLAGGTDGRDGPTDACGAIVDLRTARNVRLNGRDPVRDLHRFRSYSALDAAGALIRTGPTGTNVMDVVAVHIAPGGPGE
ncbi:MAG: DUF4147 domain-containing protein [Gemmatimonas sp.]